jgi:hypothetical protein
MKARYIAIAGKAWPVQWSGEHDPLGDPLLRAVVELVRCGMKSVQQLGQELPGLPLGLVRGATDAAISLGIIERTEAGTLNAIAADITPPPRADFRWGWVFWDPLSESLLPILVDGRKRPGKPGESTDTLAQDEPLTGSIPDRKRLGKALARLAATPELVVLGPTLGGGFEPSDDEVSSIFLPPDARGSRQTLLLPVELRDCLDDRANLVFRQAELFRNEHPGSMLWPQARSVLEGSGQGKAVLEELERTWRGARAEAVLGPLGGRYQSEEELENHLEALVPKAALCHPWNHSELRRLALAALHEAALHADGLREAGPAREMIAAAWGRFMSVLAKHMQDEVRTLLRGSWDGAPDSAAEAGKLVASLDLDLGPSEVHIAKVFDKGASAARANLERQSNPGIGTRVLFWCLAALVCEQGRSVHRARIQAVLAREPDFFRRLDLATSLRRGSAHPEQRQPTYPPGAMIADACLRCWRALGSAG